MMGGSWSMEHEKQRLIASLHDVIDFGNRRIEFLVPKRDGSLMVSFEGGGYAVIPAEVAGQMRGGVGGRYPTPEIIDEPDTPTIVGE